VIKVTDLLGQVYLECVKNNLKGKIIMRFLIVILLQFILYGADINETIVLGDKPFYEKLVKQLDHNQTQDVLNLQKTLLGKLQELSSVYHEQNISMAQVSTQKAYANLFERYLDESIKKSEYHLQLLENQQNLLLMQNQIKGDLRVDLTKELFYAFYSKNIQRLKQQIHEIDSHLLLYQKYFILSLPQVSFEPKKIQELLEKTKERLKKIAEQEKITKLKLEQSKLINNEQREKSLQVEMKTLHDKKYQLFRQKLNLTFLLFSKSLQDRDKQTFAYKERMVAFIQKHHDSRYVQVEEDLKKLFRNMEKERLGTIKTFEGESFEEIKIQLLKIWEMVNQPLFSINKTPLSIFKLLIALFIFVVGFFIAKFYKHYINNIRSRSITESTQTLLSNLGHYFIFLITFFVVLNVLGIDLSSIALVAGALSVGIGFGLQNIISNFVSGIILMLERSVKIGDYIELDENTRGRVTDIKMRSITVNTNSNIDITIPNQSLIENQVINWSMNDRIKRFEIPFGVAYGTSPQRVIEVILQAVEDMGCKNILKNKDQYTRVVMTGMGDSSVNFELFVWISGKEIFYPRRTSSKFLILIYETLYANNIEIPFPQQDIHIRSIDSKIEFK